MKNGEVEYYTIRPNLKQMYGKKVDKNTEFEEKTEDGTVTQTFKDLTLTTNVKTKSTVGEMEIEENSTVKVKVPEGTILIWSEEEGFVIPQYQMTTLPDLKKEIETIEDIYKEGGNNDPRRDEK